MCMHPDSRYRQHGVTLIELIVFIVIVSLAAAGVMYLLLTRVSGVPPLEQAMLRSRGAAYSAYQARVSSFFPRPPRPLLSGSRTA